MLHEQGAREWMTRDIICICMKGGEADSMMEWLMIDSLWRVCVYMWHGG